MKRTLLLLLFSCAAWGQKKDTIPFRLTYPAGEYKIEGNWNANYSNMIGFYKYCDGFTFKYIDILDNNTFVYYYRSCKGERPSNGNWTLKGDSIFLTHKSARIDTLLFIKGDSLFGRMDSKFGNFQAFVKKKKKNTKSKKDCCKSCK